MTESRIFTVLTISSVELETTLPSASIQSICPTVDTRSNRLRRTKSAMSRTIRRTWARMQSRLLFVGRDPNYRGRLTESFKSDIEYILLATAATVSTIFGRNNATSFGQIIRYYWSQYPNHIGTIFKSSSLHHEFRSNLTVFLANFTFVT